MDATVLVRGCQRSGSFLAGVVVILSLAQSSFAQCSTSAGGISTCSYNSDFTTGGQSLFATGNGTVSFSGTVGTSFTAANTFTSLLTGSVSQIDLGVGFVTGVNSFYAAIWTDNGGLPGTELGQWNNLS